MWTFILMAVFFLSKQSRITDTPKEKTCLFWFGFPSRGWQQWVGRHWESARLWGLSSSVSSVFWGTLPGLQFSHQLSCGNNTSELPCRLLTAIKYICISLRENMMIINKDSDCLVLFTQEGSLTLASLYLGTLGNHWSVSSSPLPCCWSDSGDPGCVWPPVPLLGQVWVQVTGHAHWVCHSCLDPAWCFPQVKSVPCTFASSL